MKSKEQIIERIEKINGRIAEQREHLEYIKAKKEEGLKMHAGAPDFTEKASILISAWDSDAKNTLDRIGEMKGEISILEWVLGSEQA